MSDTGPDKHFCTVQYITVHIFDDNTPKGKFIKAFILLSFDI